VTATEEIEIEIEIEIETEDETAKELTMNRQHLLTGLVIAVSAVALASCKQDAHKRPAAPDRSKAPESFIVRVKTEDVAANKFNVDFMASSESLKGATAAQVQRSYDKGQSLSLSEQDKGFLATDTGGNAFALNGCQGYNMPYGQYQYPYGAMPIGNIYSQNSMIGSVLGGGGGMGGGFGGIFGRILGGLFGNFGGGSGAQATPLSFQQILSQAFTGGGFMPIGLPYDQNGYQYGCGYPTPYGQQPYPYAQYPQPYGQPMPQQPYAQNYPAGYGPTAYPYMGQYQQGPYTYYTYGQQPGYQPVMQPGAQPGFQPTAQPIGQPMNQPVVPQYPTGPQAQYTYTPYPTQYSNGSTIQ